MSELIPRHLNHPPQCRVSPSQLEKKKELQHILFNKWRVDVWVTSQSSTVLFYSYLPFCGEGQCWVSTLCSKEAANILCWALFPQCFFIGDQAFPRLCHTILNLFAVSGRRQHGPLRISTLPSSSLKSLSSFFHILPLRQKSTHTHTPTGVVKIRSNDIQGVSPC